MMNPNQKLIHLVKVHSDQKKQLLKYFESEPETLDAFIAAVDNCDFPLKEWIEALDTITEWLSERDRVMPLADKIQYLNCATEIIAQGAHWDNFASAIQPILEQYGCEQSSDERDSSLS